MYTDRPFMLMLFNDGPLGSYWETDHTQHMVKELHERKWEIDSLCYPIRLAYQY